MSAQLIATDNKKLIVGLGETGLSCARYLATRGQRFAVMDSRQSPPGLDALRAAFPNAPVHLGNFDAPLCCSANELIVSPGVALAEPALIAAKAAGVTITGDIDIFSREAKAPIVAITGSNGKSTVTTLVGNMALRAGMRVGVGGNLGTPALDLLNTNAELFVLELSSFQLELVQQLNAVVATVLNLSADHLDRYGSMLDYHLAKHRIFRGAKQIVVNRGDPLSQPLLPATVGKWTFGLNQPDFRGFGIRTESGAAWLAFEQTLLMPVAELKIAGKHNIENALAALALGHAIDLPMAVMLEELRAFAGLPHRCQFVGACRGVPFFNDSKGTNVGATVAAVEGLAAADRKLIVIAGGVGKGANFAPLQSVFARHVRAAVLLGDSAKVIADALGSAVVHEFVDDMHTAVRRAFALAEDGDAVLLSPACASFDMFNNYQHRGDVFAAAVQRLIAEVGA